MNYVSSASFDHAPPAANTRPTGPVFGAIRFALLLSALVAGLADVELGRRLGGEKRAKAHLRRVSRNLRRCFGVEVEVRGSLSDDDLEVRVANHTGFLDILVLSEIGAGSFMAMHEIEGWPIIGRVAKNIGAVFVNRSDDDARREAFAELIEAAKQRSVIVFPEGLANKGPLAPFKRGAFVAARAAKLPVRPIALHFENEEEIAWVGDMPILPLVWKLLCGPNQRVTVTILDAIDARRPSTHVAHEVRVVLSRTLRKPVPERGQELPG